MTACTPALLPPHSLGLQEAGSLWRLRHENLAALCGVCGDEEKGLLLTVRTAQLWPSALEPCKTCLYSARTAAPSIHCKSPSEPPCKWVPCPFPSGAGALRGWLPAPAGGLHQEVGARAAPPQLELQVSSA